MRGDALAVQVEGNIDLTRGEEGLLNVLERKYNAQSKIAFDAIRELMRATEQPKRRVGFHS
jgi:hypothetical protein